MTGSSQIAIIGFKGCGKSAIGHIVAKKLSRPWQDTDEILESLYKRKTGETLGFREIYVRHGRGYFEDLEMEAIQTALSGEGKVISFGGGSLITMDAKGIAVGGAVFVYLSVEPDILFGRIVAQGIPAFFSTNDPRRSFDELLAKRRPIYEKYAVITVDNSHASPEETADSIIAELKRRGAI